MSLRPASGFRAFALLAVSGAVLAVPAHADRDDRKITICHVPPGNGSARHTISVGESSVDRHLDHGDYFGACRGVRRTSGDEAGDKLERAEGKLEKRVESRENREDAEDALARAKRRSDPDRNLDRAESKLEREKRYAERQHQLDRARAARDLELNAARVEANREGNTRRADERYRAKRREILDRYYDNVRDIVADY